MRPRRREGVVRSGQAVVIMVCPVCETDATKALGGLLREETEDGTEVVCGGCGGVLTLFWGRGGKGVGIEVGTVGQVRRMAEFMLRRDVGRGN